MKVLIVNDYLKHGGAESFCHDLKNKLEKKSIDVYFWTYDTFKKTEKPEINTIPEVIKFEKPDIVHFNNICLIGLEPLKYCIENNIPHIFTSHDYYPVCKTRIMLREDPYVQCQANDFRMCGRCEHRLTNLPDPTEIQKALADTPIVTTCGYMKHVFARFGYNPNNITVIKNGIDLSKYPIQENKEDGYALWSGRFHLEKGLPVFVKASELLSNHKFVITGGGTEQTTNEFGKAEYKGFLSREKYLDTMRKCRVYCLTSIWAEPVSYIQLEAQALGKPVVGFMAGGVPEYFPDGEAGLLVNMDYIEFIDALQYLLDNPKLACEMGAKGRENVEQYTLTKTCESYINLYNRVIG